jgi:iron complex outermembrane recepter protein
MKDRSAMMRPGSHALLASACSLICATAAYGQDAATTSIPAANGAQLSETPKPNSDSAIGEIVVTAQKREENIQKVPVSITALGTAELAKRGITDITQLRAAVPALQVAELSGVIEPFIRGIGTATNTFGNEASVGVYVDGVYYTRLPVGLLDLSNVSRVEVLKGPQGTLFGRNTTGGVISVVTGDPSHTTAVSGSLGYGRFGAFQGNVYATTGLSDTVAVDLSVSGKTDDGFGRNIKTGGRYGYMDEYLIRSKLLFQPSDRTKVTLSGFYSWSKNDGPKAAFPGTTVASSFLEPRQIYTTDEIGYYNSLISDVNRFQEWGVTLNAQHDLDFARLTVISAYIDSKESSFYNQDENGSGEYVAFTKGYDHVFTQELQLTSLPTSKLTWVVGAYYFNNFARYSRISLISPILFGPGVGIEWPAQQHAVSYSGYAQASYEILPKLRLTGGFRYTRDEISASGISYFDTSPGVPAGLAPGPGSDSRGKATFKAGLDYQVAPQILLYGSFSRGYKSGTFNILTYSSSTATKPETIDAYEVGLKSELFDRHLRLNMALFNYNQQNPQVQLEQNATVFFSNAGAARVRGAELEGQIAITRGLDARFSGQYLDAKYTKYDNAPAYAPDPAAGTIDILPPVNARGNSIPYAAKTTFNVGGDYTINTKVGPLTLTADLYHNSGYDFTPDNSLHQGAYYNLSSQVKLSLSDHLSIRFWGKNLTGSKYAVFAAYIAPIAAVYRPAAPRTYGGAVDFKF